MSTDKDSAAQECPTCSWLRGLDDQFMVGFLACLRADLARRWPNMSHEFTKEELQDPAVAKIVGQWESTLAQAKGEKPS